jgi:Tfp pilus assembly PilM family ATPase/Tfp pilus assembly protein PilN
MRLQDLFGKKQTEVVTVEIDDMCLKMAHGKRTDGKATVSKVRILSGKALSDDEISSAIGRFFEDVKFEKGEVISVIPSRFGIYKNVEVPSIDEGEICQIVDLQAGAHTPYPKNEIVIDHINVGVFHERYTKILLVIFKKDVISRRYDLIKKAGYKTEKAVLAAEAEAGIFFEAIPSRKPGEVTAIVDVDISFSNFTVIYGGKTIYMRSIPSGIKELSENKADGMTLFCQEVKKSLEAYQASNVEDAPSRIFFIGKKDIVDVLAANFRDAGEGPEAVGFDISSETSWLASGKLEVADDVSAFSVVSPVLDLGKSRLDLTPEDVRVRREIEKKSKEAMKFGVLAMTVLLLFCAALLSNLMLKNMYLNKLEKSYVSENEEVSKLNAVMDSTSRVKKIIAEKGVGLSGMALLFRSMPSEVFLTSVDFREGNVFTFTGTADSMSMVFSLVTELENSASFKDVKVDFTRSRRQSGKEVADFGLTLKYEREAV